MNITGITSSTPPHAALGSFDSHITHIFNIIQRDLEAKDLSSAQNLFSAFRDDVQRNGEVSPLAAVFGQNGSLNEESRALQTAFESNEIVFMQIALWSLMYAFQKLLNSSII